MDPAKLDELRKKSKAELMAQLKDLKAELKERSIPGAKVTDGAPNKLSEIEKLHPFFSKEMKMKRAALQEELREAYRNRKPLILRLNSKQDPCCTAASPPDTTGFVSYKWDGRIFSEDGEAFSEDGDAFSEDGEAFSEDGEGKEA